ncbi:ornithine carbamoyltransferase [Dehalogenimonas etheniformans]|uniref:Ornithine carbamoyltransferase n=1 Tax=Dehalogenimonas etheniformans TaxID=1536648 RepID=A0A2P5P5F6_9CHLR|nr:ornithine carbamoyltransferase [Dehalogenimonas etheniformans]PPD57517.1 ornithine carbamoyltransferase [Dehalogenimonas etheniformans]QNT76878.1 ornithine carbamoyltransferase [Dehalogenimonas etheniformans]
MKSKDFLSVTDLAGHEIRMLLSDAASLKAQGWQTTLSGKTLALLFEKPSLRTRVSFELAMKQLGGEAIYLSPAEVGLGKRESIADVARVLSRFVDAIAVRTFAQSTLEELAQWAGVPVINALSDAEHPCQALADLLTIYEHKGEFPGLKLAFVGDGNNVAVSLALAAASVGLNFTIATPKGYELPGAAMKRALDRAAVTESIIEATYDPNGAVRDADIIYTDSWTSMGQEAEAEIRRKAFNGFQVDDQMVSLAKPDAIIMHCLPAHYGEEVAEGLLNSPQSVVFDQAENRLHVQKALLADMLGGLCFPWPG